MIVCPTVRRVIGSPKALKIQVGPNSLFCFSQMPFSGMAKSLSQSIIKSGLFVKGGQLNKGVPHLNEVHYLNF